MIHKGLICQLCSLVVAGLGKQICPGPSHRPKGCSWVRLGVNGSCSEGGISCRRSSDTPQLLLLLNQNKKVKFGSFPQNVNLGTVQKRKPYLSDLFLLSYYTKSGKTKTLGSGKCKISRRFGSIFSSMQ